MTKRYRSARQMMTAQKNFNCISTTEKYSNWKSTRERRTTMDGKRLDRMQQHTNYVSHPYAVKFYSTKRCIFCASEYNGLGEEWKKRDRLLFSVLKHTMPWLAIESQSTSNKNRFRFIWIADRKRKRGNFVWYLPLISCYRLFSLVLAVPCILVAV